MADICNFSVVLNVWDIQMVVPAALELFQPCRGSQIAYPIKKKYDQPVLSTKWVALNKTVIFRIRPFPVAGTPVLR